MLFGACSETEPSKSVRQEAVGKGTPQALQLRGHQASRTRSWRLSGGGRG